MDLWLTRRGEAKVPLKVNKILHSDLGMGMLVWGVSVGCLREVAMFISPLRNLPHLRKAYWTDIPTLATRQIGQGEVVLLH